MTVPYTHVVFLSGMLFLLGMLCLIIRRNLIMMLLGLEVMLNAAAIAFVGASLHIGQLTGQAMTLFILAVAATEVAVGLALAVCIYRRTGTVDPACIEGDQCSL